VRFALATLILYLWMYIFMGISLELVTPQESVKNCCKTWYSWHVWDHRVAGYHSFSDIRKLHLMCIIVYLAASWMGCLICHW